MGLIQLIAALWPFLKEMFIGEKIKDAAPSKDAAADKAQEKKKYASPVANIAGWCIRKMQGSSRFLTLVLVLFMLSLFINYKVISKLAATITRKEEQVHAEQPAAKDPKEVPTIPHSPNSERDKILNQTMKELATLYGQPI